jgi:excisionase family DNA binding protein
MEKIAVSVAEAGRSIGIGRTKLYELINDGSLKTFKVGRRTLVTTASIHALVGQASCRCFRPRIGGHCATNLKLATLPGSRRPSRNRISPLVPRRM